MVWRTIGKRVLLAIGIFIPALLVGLVQNLPTLEFYMQSTRLAGFEEQTAVASRLEENLSWIQSLMIVFPRLFGDYIQKNMPLEHYLLNYGYVGIVTLLAALFAGWIERTKRQIWFWRIAATIFFISIIWNWFYFDLLCNLPLFRVSLQKPFSPLFFSLIVLAGHGFAFLLEPKKKGTPGNRWMGYTSVLIFGCALSLGGILLYGIVAPNTPFDDEQMYVFGQMGIGAGLAALACLVVGIYWRIIIRRNDTPDEPGGNRSVAIAALFLMLIILIDLWPMKTHFNPFVPKDKLFFKTSSIDFLVSNLDWEPGDPDGPYRFGRSWKDILPPNTGMVFGLDDFGGYDSNLIGRYAKLLDTIDTTIVEGVHFIESPRKRAVFEKNIWDMLGVKYIVAHPGHLGQFDPTERWNHVYNDEILILKNENVLPRMHLVENFTVTTDDEEALRLTTELDPSVEAVVEYSPDRAPISIELMQVLDPPIYTTGTPLGTVVITDYHPEKVTASVSVNRHALLCFFDTWFPGWSVTVDGSPAQLELVNYTFKGVFLNEGDHEVIFSYRPKMVLYGLVGTLFGIIIALLLVRKLSCLAGKKSEEHSSEPRPSGSG